MTIPLLIEATEPTTGLTTSVSVITLEGVLSASSFRFCPEEEGKFGRRNSQGPVVKPARKRSSTDLLFSYGDGFASIGNRCLHNATFSDDDDARSEFKVPKPARLQNILSSDASCSSSVSRRSRPRSRLSQDHLFERYMNLFAKAQTKKTAPQKPRRKSSSIRLTSSTCMPLSMPVRKASAYDVNSFQGRRRDTV